MNETYPQRIERLAREVVHTWNVWCSSADWDNREYDDLASALRALERTLKHPPFLTVQKDTKAR